MAARLFALVVGVLGTLLPLGVRASTTSAELALTPAQGAPGSHFTATFTFTEAPCSAYAVYFFWDAPNHATPLGGSDATGPGPTCQVSLQLTVPSTDADPNHSYAVLASAQTRQVAVGGSAGAVTSSTNDSGTSEFKVIDAQSQAPSGVSDTSPSSRGASPGSTSAPVDRASNGTGLSSGAGVSALADAPSSSPSPDAANGSASSAGLQAPPLAAQQPHIRPTGGMGTAILAAVAALAITVASAWVYRSGRLRFILRR